MIILDTIDNFFYPCACRGGIVQRPLQGIWLIEDTKTSCGRQC